MTSRVRWEDDPFREEKSFIDERGGGLGGQGPCLNRCKLSPHIYSTTTIWPAMRATSLSHYRSDVIISALLGRERLLLTLILIQQQTHGQETDVL